MEHVTMLHSNCSCVQYHGIGRGYNGCYGISTYDNRHSLRGLPGYNFIKLYNLESFLFLDFKVCKPYFTGVKMSQMTRSSMIIRSQQQLLRQLYRVQSTVVVDVVK